MKIKQNNSIIPLKLLLLCFGERVHQVIESFLWKFKWQFGISSMAGAELAHFGFYRPNFDVPILILLYNVKNKGENLDSTLYHQNQVHTTYIKCLMPSVYCLQF